MSDAIRHTPLDVALAELAARQHAVVSLEQLLRLGLTPSGVRYRVQSGRLHRVHRGVYSVGHRLLSTEGHWMAAVLACGRHAVLSHHAAAELWGLARRSSRVRIDVTSPTRTGRELTRIRVHSGATLTAADVTALDRIPCTSVARTLLDCADVCDQNATDRLVERAEAKRLFDLTAVQELLDRSAGRRGAPKLQRAIAHHTETITRSDVEDAMLGLCADAGLPIPAKNVWLPEFRYEVDFIWRAHQLIVEADSRTYHGTFRARERDYERDRRLRDAGWRIERFSDRQIVHQQAHVARALAKLLSAAA
jgi:predicted transcriptional regulator of viral defense system